MSLPYELRIVHEQIKFFICRVKKRREKENLWEYTVHFLPQIFNDKHLDRHLQNL